MREKGAALVSSTIPLHLPTIPVHALPAVSQPPGFKAVWHCGVRVASTGKLVAFISGVPATLRVNAATLTTHPIAQLCDKTCHTL